MKFAWTCLVILACGCMPLTKDTNVDSWLTTASQPPAMDERGASIDVVLADAQQAEDNGDVEGATMRYRDAMRQAPKAVAPIRRLAVLLDREGQTDESEKLYAQALRLAPRDVGLLTDYAYSRYLRGDLKAAKEMLVQALEIDPRFERAHNNLALVLSREGKDAEAVSAFERGGLTQDEALENLQQAKRASELSRSSVTR